MSNWFPIGKNGNDSGWRLDIVSLLAVIGESSIESHSQALTASWTCWLPRMIPAPQVLLKPSRPNRMPQVNAAVVGVHNGTSVPTLNYFPNIIHPIEELQPFAFRVLEIKHKPEEECKDKKAKKATASLVARSPLSKDTSTTTSTDFTALENGLGPVQRRQTALGNIAGVARKLTAKVTPKKKERPRVPPQKYSPLTILSLLSCILTIGLLVTAIVIKDGTACVALGTISVVSSIVGYASWWTPVLMDRRFVSKVPDGDVIIRTREGAFLLVKCNEYVSRELYTGTEECKYYVQTQLYRILVGTGTFFLMISVVLLGNCNFAMQAAIGSSYIVLNGAFWCISLIEKKAFWDLSAYVCEDITPAYAKHADVPSHRGKPIPVEEGAKPKGKKGKKAEQPKPPKPESLEDQESFTRTMWYAIRETKKIGWVKRSGAAPLTDKWDEWLQLAEKKAIAEDLYWNAVEMREKIVGGGVEEPQKAAHGQTLQVPQTEAAAAAQQATIHEDNAEQHVPAVDIQPPETVDSPK